MPHDTLAEALEALDALIAEAACLPGGDLQALIRDVRGDVAPQAHARGIDVVMEVVGQSESLTGRDLRRWRYLLRQALASFVEELPAGSPLRVELACVATTSGHRWLQADVHAPPGPAGAAASGANSSDANAPGREGFRPVLVQTALRLLEGACEGAATRDGRVLRLVAPVEL
jgi:hypothetical protein